MAPAEAPSSLILPNNNNGTGGGGTRNRTAALLLGLILLARAEAAVKSSSRSQTHRPSPPQLEVRTKGQRQCRGERYGPNSTHAAAHADSRPPRSYLLNAGTTRRDKRVSYFAPRSSPLSAAMANDGGGGGMWSVLRDFRGGHGSHRQSPVDVTAAADAAAEALGGAANTCTTLPLNIPLNGWKAIFQILLTTLNVLCWYVPLKHKTLRENKLGLSLANAFSGGVFLSLAFGHLIPECVHGFAGQGNEALPYMIMLGGYLLIFFVEKVAFDAHGMLEGHTHEDGHGHGHSHGSVNGASASTNGKGGAKGTTTVTATSTASPQKPRSSSPPPSTVTRQDSGSSGGVSSGRSAVILLGALAVHSILEMASLGLSSNFADCALLSLSIGLHQPAESIALLVAFLKSGMSERQIVQYLSAFSVMGPMGTGLGVAVQQFASPLVDSVMLAVVAGTFIYVGATEVIPEEWEDQEHKWKKFAALLGGIVSIYVITQYTAGLEV